MSQFYALAQLTGHNIPTRFRGKYTAPCYRAGVTFKFPAPEARRCIILPAVRTFTWFNPVNKLFHVCEEKSGAFICSGGLRGQAEARAKMLMTSVGDKKFFARLTRIGDHKLRDEITTQEALDGMTRTSLTLGLSNPTA